MGQNVSADGIHTAAFLSTVLPRGAVIRCVFIPQLGPQLQYAYVRSLKLAGFQVLLVIARESFTRPEGGAYTSEELFELLAQTMGDWVDYVQVGNEWDHISASSWTLDPISLNHHLWAACQTRTRNQLHWTIVLGGAVSGDPFALDHIDLSLVDMVAVHPYGQRPFEGWKPVPNTAWGFGDVANLLAGYVAHAQGKPVIVTEYGLPTQDFGDQASANYHAAMARVLNDLVPIYIPFCLDDNMVDGFGWFRNGQDKPQAKTMIPLLASMYPQPQAPVLSPPDPQGVTLADFVLGFAAKADELGRDIVGDPLEDQDYLPLKNGGEIAFQFTTTGVMLYSKTAGTVHFFEARKR